MQKNTRTFFAPQLHIKSGATNVDFYVHAFGAVEIRRFSNDDGTIHVSELSIDGALFHLHEQKQSTGRFDPLSIKGSTAIIGLFVPDVDEVVTRAVKAGATLMNPPTDYDYGYRQAEISDPFGHFWLIEKKILY